MSQSQLVKRKPFFLQSTRDNFSTSFILLSLSDHPSLVVATESHLHSVDTNLFFTRVLLLAFTVIRKSSAEGRATIKTKDNIWKTPVCDHRKLPWEAKRQESNWEAELFLVTLGWERKSHVSCSSMREKKLSVSWCGRQLWPEWDQTVKDPLWNVICSWNIRTTIVKKKYPGDGVEKACLLWTILE